jgi:hypothetical protein
VNYGEFKQKVEAAGYVLHNGIPVPMLRDDKRPDAPVRVGPGSSIAGYHVV